MIGTASALLLLTLASPRSGQGPLATAGSERTTYLLTHPSALPPIPDHVAAGYRQRVVRRDARSAVVEVVVEAEPLASMTPYPPDFLPPEASPYLETGPWTEALRSEAERAALGSPDLHAASARLVALAGRRVQDVPSPSPALVQDPLTVWRRGRGTCIGRANLAVALLREAGIPARTVHGIRLAGPPGTEREVSSALLHRWIEVFFPDRGWVPSDPAASIHYVRSSYLLLELGGDRPAALDPGLRGLRVRVLDRRGEVAPSDEADPAVGLVPGDPPVLPDTARRTAAAVEALAPPGSRIGLIGPGVSRTGRADGQGRHTFVGLSPGLYRLRCERGPETVLLVAGTEMVRVPLR